MSQSQLSKESAAMLAAFQKQPEVTNVHYQNLVDIITSSPLLTERFNLAVANKHISGLKPLDQANAGGTFDPSTKAISLPLDSLATASSRNDMVFVLAHEIQHCFNHQKTHKATQQFLNDVKVQAQQKGVRDYTDEVKTLLTANRKDEASAEIAGFNAVVSAVKRTQSNPSLYELYHTTSYIHDFIKQDKKGAEAIYTLKSNLTLNKDMTLSETTKNLEAMGVHYFDKSPEQTGLGYRGTSDYTNYYATWAVGNAITFERAYNPESKEPLILNMTGLRLQEKILEENGLHTGHNPMNYKDIGKNPPFIGRFDHTYDGTKHNTWVPIAYEKSILTTVEQDPLQARLDAMLNRVNRAVDAYQKNDGEAIRAANHEMIAASPVAQKMLAGHEAFLGKQRQQQEQENRLYSLENMPQRAQDLHGQIQEKFTAYVKEHNLPYSERGIQNSIGALTSEAYAQKLSGIDHLAVNNGKLSAMQEGRVVSDYASVDAAKAAATPERESFKEILQSEQNLEREAEQREMARQMEQSRGMGMSR